MLSLRRFVSLYLVVSALSYFNAILNCISVAYNCSGKWLVVVWADIRCIFLTSFVNLFLIVMKFHLVLYAMVPLLIVVSSDTTNQHGHRLSIQSVTIPIYCFQLHGNNSKHHGIQNKVKFHHY